MNHPELTKEERYEVEKYILGMEKRIERWPRERWMLVVVGMAFLGIAAFSLAQVDVMGVVAGFHNVGDSVDLTSPSPTRGEISLFVMALVADIALYLLSLPFLTLGLLFIIGSSSQWNRHHRLSAELKIYKARLADYVRSDV